MEFSEFSEGMFKYAYCPENGEMKEARYFDDMVSNFLKDNKADGCKALKLKDDMKSRFVSGNRTLSAVHARYIYKNRDTSKFSKWIGKQIYDAGTYDDVQNWLIRTTDKTQDEVDALDPDELCMILALMLEGALSDIVNNEKEPSKKKPVLSKEEKLIEEINAKIGKLPSPQNVPIPESISAEENIYISELYRAYADAEEIDSFDEHSFVDYPEYEEDLVDRRIDFYAAETIRRGVLEFGEGTLSNQFEVLKEETHDGIKDTARRKYSDGYEKMLAVMEQSVKIDPVNYILGRSPYWISAKIKKGVCHHLVNDGRLTWVKK